MDLYHSWLYVNILNTKWFIWTIVVSVFGFNMLGVIPLWFVMLDKKGFGKGKEEEKKQ